MHNDVSRNALDDEPDAAADTINRLVWGAISPWQRSVVGELRNEGYIVHPWLSGRLHITTPDGQRKSLKQILMARHTGAVQRGRCEVCGRAILLALVRPERVVRGKGFVVRLPARVSRKRKRGPRTDRLYCSNACRQHAYRERQRGPGRQP